MRKVFAVLVVSVIAALAVPSLALATHSNGQGPDKDFVNGSARGPLPTPCGSVIGHFHTNGQSTTPVTGFPASGHFFTDITFDPPCLGIPAATFSGDVTCVNAAPGPDGNGADWRGVITESNVHIPGLLDVGLGVLSRHVDNGEPGVGNDRAVGFVTPPPPPSCPTTPFTTSPITQGNLIVHDGI
jgi:hypothetical protein